MEGRGPASLGGARAAPNAATQTATRTATRRGARRAKRRRELRGRLNQAVKRLTKWSNAGPSDQTLDQTVKHWKREPGERDRAGVNCGGPSRLANRFDQVGLVVKSGRPLGGQKRPTAYSGQKVVNRFVVKTAAARLGVDGAEEAEEAPGRHDHALVLVLLVLRGRGGREEGTRERTKEREKEGASERASE